MTTISNRNYRNWSVKVMPFVPAHYLFTRYQIPSNLKQHLIQVASLGQLICQNWIGSPFNQDHLMTALLLHDIGNLVKYNLEQDWTKKILTTSSAQNSHLPQSLAAWQELQARFQQRYHQNADEASLAIVRELKIDPAIIDILSDHTFDDLEPLLLSGNWPRMILFYCDLRFAPIGLVSVAQRLDDLRFRYQKYDPRYTNTKIFECWLNYSLALEKQLQQHTSFIFSQLSSTQLEPLFPKLLQFKIQIGV